MDISLEAREREIGQLEDAASLQKAKQELAQSTAAQNYDILTKLAEHPGWRFFIESELKPIVKELHDTALDPARTSAEHEVAIQRHAFGVDIIGKLEERRKFWATKAGYTVVKQ